MQEFTLATALIFSLLAITLRPKYILITYITVLLWYPSYLVVRVGTIDITVGRIVVGVLLLRCLFDSRIKRKFKWLPLDTYVTLSMVVYVGVFCISVPLSIAVENRAGFLMDAWFAYLVARFCITNERELVGFIKWVAVLLAPLAILGVLESVTGWRGFAMLSRNSPAFTYLTGYGTRLGFFRAMGPFSHPILFGCGFAMFLPLIYYLRHEKGNWRFWGYVLACAVACGALSSMSSGPWVIVIVVIFCIAMEKMRRWCKPILIFVVVSCIFTELISNRHFYYVFASHANLMGGASWHRAKLIDVAIAHFSDWWLLGYGMREPGWGHYFGMSRTDAPNEFIMAGIRYGLLGIIALCSVLAMAFHCLLRVYKRTVDSNLKHLYWSFGTVLFSVTIAWMSTSFFGQLVSIFYCILGIIGSSFGFVQYEKIGGDKYIMNR